MIKIKLKLRLTCSCRFNGDVTGLTPLVFADSHCTLHVNSDIVNCVCILQIREIKIFLANVRVCVDIYRLKSLRE